MPDKEIREIIMMEFARAAGYGYHIRMAFNRAFSETSMFLFQTGSLISAAPGVMYPICFHKQLVSKAKNTFHVLVEDNYLDPTDVLCVHLDEENNKIDFAHHEPGHCPYATYMLRHMYYAMNDCMERSLQESVSAILKGEEDE